MKGAKGSTKKRKASPFGRLCYKVRDRLYRYVSITPKAVRIMKRKFRKYVPEEHTESRLRWFFSQPSIPSLNADNIKAILDQHIPSLPPSPTRTLTWADYEDEETHVG
jgi:hypothetical protein